MTIQFGAFRVLRHIVTRHGFRAHAPHALARAC